MPGQKPAVFLRNAPLTPHAQLYLDDLRDEGSSVKTVRDYRSTLIRFVKYYPERPLSDFNGPTGTRLLQDFIRDEFISKGRASGTVKKQIAALRGFFGWCDDFELIGRDPSRRLKVPKGRRKPRKPIPLVNVHRLIESQPEACDRLALTLAYELATRAGAVRGIRLGDFDLESGHVHITTKGGKEQDLPLVNPVLRLLVEELYALGWQDDHYLLHVRRVNNLPGHKREMPFPKKPLSETAFFHWRQKCFDRADAANPDLPPLPRHDFHSLRHTAGTEFYKETRDLKATQMLLGHASIQTTGDHYVTLDEIAVIEGLEKVRAARQEEE